MFQTQKYPPYVRCTAHIDNRFYPPLIFLLTKISVCGQLSPRADAWKIFQDKSSRLKLGNLTYSCLAKKITNWQNKNYGGIRMLLLLALPFCLCHLGNTTKSALVTLFLMFLFLMPNQGLYCQPVFEPDNCTLLQDNFSQIKVTKKARGKANKYFEKWSASQNRFDYVSWNNGDNKNCRITQTKKDEHKTTSGKRTIYSYSIVWEGYDKTDTLFTPKNYLVHSQFNNKGKLTAKISISLSGDTIDTAFFSYDTFDRLAQYNYSRCKRCDSPVLRYNDTLSLWVKVRNAYCKDCGSNELTHYYYESDTYDRIYHKTIKTNYGGDYEVYTRYRNRGRKVYQLYIQYNKPGNTQIKESGIIPENLPKRVRSIKEYFENCRIIAYSTGRYDNKNRLKLFRYNSSVGFTTKRIKY